MAIRDPGFWERFSLPSHQDEPSSKEPVTLVQIASSSSTPPHPDLIHSYVLRIPSNPLSIYPPHSHSSTLLHPTPPTKILLTHSSPPTENHTSNTNRSATNGADGGSSLAASSSSSSPPASLSSWCGWASTAGSAITKKPINRNFPPDMIFTIHQLPFDSFFSFRDKPCLEGIWCMR